MFILYDLIFLIFTLICLPVYLCKGKFHKGFLARLGILPKDLNLGGPIWIHAVSLGEAISVRGLIEGLRRVYPDKKFVISTVTPTGNKIAKELAKPGDLVTYLPLDFSFIVRSVINRINPQIFIIAETEIWPNLIACLYKKNVPVIIVNGRISDASFRGYSAVRPLIKPILSKVSRFCVQSDTDANKLKQLGVTNDKIRVTGNMKFDQLVPVRQDGFRERLDLSSGEELFIAGSTHPGEEEIILGAYAGLLNEFPGLRLLIAPRHPERAREVAQVVLKNGFEALRVSQLKLKTDNPVSPKTVFILDTVGELINFYAAADIVFVGGSLIKRGGHNILEPASLGKPVIFGTHMFNFRDMAAMFLEKNAAILVNNQKELSFAVERLLRNKEECLRLADNARQVITQNQGATKRNIEEACLFINR